MAECDWLTPQQVADELQCSYDTVLAHVRLGTIRASDVSASSSARRKPIYRIHREDLEAFLASRRNDPPPPYRRSKRARHKSGGVIEFFK